MIKKFIKNNKRLSFVILMFLIVILFVVYIYFKTISDLRGIYSTYDTITNEQEQTIKFILNFALKEVVLFSAIIFIGTFLIIRASEKDKNIIK